MRKEKERGGGKDWETSYFHIVDFVRQSNSEHHSLTIGSFACVSMISDSRVQRVTIPSSGRLDTIHY